MNIKELIDALMQLPPEMELHINEPNGSKLPIPRLADLPFYIKGSSLFVNEDSSDRWEDERIDVRLADYLKGHRHE